MRYFYSALSTRTIHYYPIVIARDGGNRTVQCNLFIEVYRFYDTVSVQLLGDSAGFNPHVFVQLLSDLLGYNIQVTLVDRLNDR